ncbi:aldo/keto reductase [Sporolactobacillus terrae]|uniref:Aldo/keto reductase n=1 Tax=Sporolactobacillus terrae TaxID=269673 RepID=A0ABX5Q9S5_9BACL|nr:aldo/keto reductase [Sporolactobacillus terrae]QAA23379.1 aldo/keto reductase [Sporolactobacillus terrae]QAA26350.1 aldo/keto reductase [Sporolactobacillus terrae]UAK15441.1 aldo/keto reductase [Sporolactobacillus terrae]
MSKVKIGKSQVETVPLGLGTNKVGGHNLFSNLSESDGLETVHAALKSGIQLLDTAFIYGKGRSEELIGEVIANFPREQVIIADKAAHDFSSGEMVLNNNPQFLKQSVDDALKRLKTDYIDIFYIHFPDKETPKSEAVGALQELREAGKIRAIGISNFSFEQTQEANQDGYVDVIENYYSLIHRDEEEKLFPYLRDAGISFVPYFPLESGLLTGKFNKDTTFAESDPRSKDAKFNGEAFQKTIQNLDAIRSIAQNHHVDVLQVVLAWYLANPDLTAVIPGARNAGQIPGIVHALDVKLSKEEYDLIDRTFTNR